MPLHPSDHHAETACSRHHLSPINDAVESHTFRGAGDVELPAAGLGILNYELYLKLLAKNHPNIPIIIEHIAEDDIPRAKKFVDDTLKKIGA